MSTILRQHIEKIVPLTDEEFDRVMSHFKTRKLKKHQFLLQEGDTAHAHFDNFVVSGLLKVYHTSDDGHEHILQFAPEDWWVADYRANYFESSAVVNISCLENSELLTISYANREQLCKEFHKLEHFFRKKATGGFVSQQRRILSLLNNNAKERYEEFLSLYPGLSQRLSKTLIASYLGVSRETLSRLSD
ncbi:Crp/Fnr family transcriptional regulator [Pseudobacter ginsenosidimutans]|uniref:CRP-like cAMP-binding protein n=1 Tax=Pseudobacter ginsenosidimutans TaxID=661488 RepID=A0A4Q7MTU6_9BACT|nr:Crp/Fnr family transcriptional regulator [Pseudobacter ginsenosidimutans]QEC40980.1 Crp/Fnr family transcriptional regulator [Pseudobacter ginsenosidimutans]RZS72275.1 CRP-like cAMP-binding protein [Pseudobacter ginsenosidimutans]